MEEEFAPLVVALDELIAFFVLLHRRTQMLCAEDCMQMDPRADVFSLLSGSEKRTKARAHGGFLLTQPLPNYLFTNIP